MYKRLTKIIVTVFSIVLAIFLSVSTPVLASNYSSNPVKFIDVAAGLDHSMALASDGKVWCWGDNEYGQIANGTHGDGNGDTVDNIQAKPYLVMDKVRSISATYEDCFTITNDNSLWVWGWNIHGRVGNGGVSDCTLPVKVLTNAKLAASGKANHSVVVKNDGSLWAWGLNMDGQIGDGTKENRYTPVNVMKDVQYAAAGEGHTMVIKKNGDLYVWGRNWEGQLGDGTGNDRIKPFKLMSNVQKAVAGSNQSYFITKDGTLWGCGKDVTGKISRPQKLMSEVKDVSAGIDYYIIIKKDGTLWGCGNNEYGEFGDGTCQDKSKPVKIMSNVIKAAAGDGFILVVKKDGTLWTCGRNNRGQLGTGDTKDRTRLVQIKDFPSSGVRASIGKLQNSMAMDGSLTGWKGIKPIASDPSGDAEEDAADITSIFAVKDSKYLYVAVKVLGSNPIVDLNIDTNGDGKEDYLALCYANDRMAYIFDSSHDGKVAGYVPVGYKDAVELKVPLALFSSANNLRINACIKHKTGPDDVCKDYDLMDGWYKVQ